MKRTRLLGLVLLLAGCSGPVATATIPAQPVGPQTPAPGAGTSGPSSATVPIDASLLRFLPERIGAFTVNYSPEATQEVVGDKTLVVTAASVAYGIAADPATGDVVVAAVVKLQPGAFNASFYRDWRESYDRASCDPAGGVRGRAEATMGGRTVFIGTCNGGAHTYHAHLETAGILISATSVGAKRFGEELVGNLRP